ncbi:MAG: GNAT family N-acetyltransferase [Lentisphaeria bacterium]|nr:GNAT family N-acetyltransferase [Lentisphaeria bacterium]
MSNPEIDVFPSAKFVLTTKKDDDFWGFRFEWNGCDVAYANCELTAENVLGLSDICVENNLLLPPSLKKQLPSSWRNKTGTGNFRSLGIGTALLKRVIEEAEKAGIKKIWGSVTHDAVKENEHLLGWYERQGFTTHPADDECLENAVFKVVMKLSSND